MKEIILIIIFMISISKGSEIKTFKSAKNQGMNYFERFEYIEGYLTNLSKDYLKEKQLKKELEQQKKENKKLQETISNLEKKLSSFEKKLNSFDEKKILDLKRKVDRIDNVDLNRIDIRMRNLKERIELITEKNQTK